MEVGLAMQSMIISFTFCCIVGVLLLPGGQSSLSKLFTSSSSGTGFSNSGGFSSSGGFSGSRFGSGSFGSGSFGNSGSGSSRHTFDEPQQTIFIPSKMLQSDDTELPTLASQPSKFDE